MIHFYDPVGFILTLCSKYSNIDLTAKLAKKAKDSQNEYMAKNEIKNIGVSYRLEPEILAQLLVLTSLKPGTTEVQTIRELIAKRYAQALKDDKELVLKQRKAADQEIASRLSSLASARKQKKE